MKKIYVALFLFSFFFSAQQSSAQTYPVTVTVLMSPPFSPYIADYVALEGNQVISLLSTAPTTLEVKLTATLNANNGIEAHTDPAYHPANPIILEPGVPLTLIADNEIFGIHSSDINHNIDPSVFLIGILPEGMYTYCVQVRDYNDNSKLSDPALGCTTVPITYPPPPSIITPICESSFSNFSPANIIFSWSPSIGAPAGSILMYDLYLLKLNSGDNAQDVMNAAIQFNSGNPVKISNNIVTSYSYTDLDPVLANGDYACAVVVRDLSSLSVFHNNGIGPVCKFTLTDPSGLDGGTVSAPASGACSCASSFPADNTIKNSIVHPATVIKAGDFDLTVIDVMAVNGKLNGTGKINLPVVNSSYVPVRVSFEGLSVNQSLDMLEGNITAMKRADGAGLMPNANPLQPSLVPFSSTQAASLDQYFTSNVNQLVSQMTASAQSIGLELPLGIDKATSPYTIAITDLRLNVQETVFDAAVSIPIPDGSTTIALAAKNVCVSPTNVCGQGLLYLAEDLNIPSIGLKLKGADPNDLAGNPGTYVVFDKDGFNSFHIKAEFEIPGGLIARHDNSMPVVATLDADCQKWTDWMASISLPAFHVVGMEDFVFDLKAGGVYDHSSLQNPAGLPSIPAKTNLATSTWNGFYLQELEVRMPEVFKSIGGMPVKFSANNLIIDGQGVTGDLMGNNLLTLDQGTLDGWYFSMDHVGIKFLNNSFTEGGLYGKLMLPISGDNLSNPNSQLDYSCTLKRPASSFEYEFLIQLKNNLVIPIWYATAGIKAGSTILVSNASGGFVASANLSGDMSIATNDLPYVGPIEFGHLEYEGLWISSQPNGTGKYIGVDKFHASLNSPQRYISGNANDGSSGGFPVGLDNVQMKFTGSQIGIQFDLNLTLADIDKLPSATGTIILWSNISFSGGRPHWNIADPEVTKIKVKGPVGPVTVDGEINFFRDDDKFGNGIMGVLKATMIGVGELDAQAMFGKKDFFYWYVDMNLIMPPPGITLCTPPGPPISIIGFGGGAYYNLAQSYPAGTVNTSPNLKDRYTPQPGWGFKGVVYLSSNDGQLYIAKGTFTVELTDKLAPLTMSIETNGAMFRTDPTDMNFDNAMVQVNGAIGYNFAQNILRGELWEKYNPIPPFLTSEWKKVFDLYVDANQRLWHIKIGDVDVNNRIPCVIPPIPPIIPAPIPVGVYLAAGNYDVPAFVEPPDQIKLALAKCGKSYGNNRMSTAEGTSCIFGGAFGIPPTEFKMMPFKLRGGAQAGFDVALTHFDTDCDGNPDGDKPGFNGWYTSGQLWAYATGKISLFVDLDFIEGDVDVFEVDAGMILSGGLPNPTWGRGTIYGSFSVMGGIIKGSFDFDVAFSSSGKVSCQATQTDPLRGAKLLGDVDPQNGSTGVSIAKNVSAAFNFALNSPFDVEFVNTNGSTRVESYQVVLEEMTLRKQIDNSVFATTMDWGGLTEDQKIILKITNDGFLATFYSRQTLTPQNWYKLFLKVRLQKWNGTDFVNTDYLEELAGDYKFKSGDCLTDIQDLVVYSFPLPQQRYFIPTAGAEGFIETNQDVGCLGGLFNQFTVEFRNGSGVLSVAATKHGDYFTFTIPALQNDQSYTMTLIQEKIPFVMSNYVGMSFRNMYVHPAANIEFSDNKIANENVSPMKVVLYSSFFHVSHFNSYVDKLMAFSAQADNVTKNSSESYTAKFQGMEGLDEYDVIGYPLTKFGTTTYAPLFTVSEASPPTGAYNTNYINPMYQNMAVVRSYLGWYPIWRNSAVFFNNWKPRLANSERPLFFDLNEMRSGGYKILN